MWYTENKLYLAAFKVPESMREWLTGAGSLVTRLRNHGVGPVRVTQLRETWACPWQDERTQLNIANRRCAFIREILIGEEGRPYIFARTIFPMDTLTGAERRLAKLGTRTLGSVLFKDPTLTRSSFEITCLQPGTTWYQHIQQYHPVDNSPLWARRSIFTIKEKPLLVTEVFLRPI